MFDRESDPTLEESGEFLDQGLAALWRRHLSEGVAADGRDTFTAFHLRVLPAGPRYDMPRGSQWTETSRRLRAWAATPAHFALLAAHTPEEVYRRAAADPAFLPGACQ